MKQRIVVANLDREDGPNLDYRLRRPIERTKTHPHFMLCKGIELSVEIVQDHFASVIGHPPFTS
jgi:hypothetical protein